MMRTTRESLSRAWPGPFPDRRELPREPVYDVRLAFHHTANGGVEAALREALAPFAGEPLMRKWPLRSTTLTWESHQPPVQATLRGDKVEVRFGNRIKGNALWRLVEALSKVPGAAALTLSGHTRGREVCDDTVGGACCH